MKRFGIKEIRTAIEVLSGIDRPVDNGLLVYLSEMLRDAEERVRSKMSDEELAVRDAKMHWKLRVTRKDGSIIPGKRNTEIFFQAIKESNAGYDELKDIHIANKYFVRKRGEGRRTKGYKLLIGDMYIYREYNSRQMAEILDRIDDIKHLDWDIELM